MLHYTKLEFLVRYLIEHYNEETDLVNEQLAAFVASLDHVQTRPVVPKPRPLSTIKITNAGHPDLEITGTSFEHIKDKLERYFEDLDAEVGSVTSKSVFDKLGVKTERRKLFSILEQVACRIRPDVKVKRK